MILDTVGLDFDDLLIVPATISEISSRKECNIYDSNGMLPLFTAPMDTVVDCYNSGFFEENKIYSILPRTADAEFNEAEKYPWIAVGLQEFEALVDNPTIHRRYVLVDIANGHMKKLQDLVRRAKKVLPNTVLMIGNIACLETFRLFASLDVEVDYCRIGIGNGSGCLTTQNVGVGYPLASLIYECGLLQRNFGSRTKIVADGGMKNYSDIIKALALGADYVMLGGIFNKALESAGDTFRANVRHENWVEPGDQVDQYAEETWCAFNSGAKFYKKFRGMSTKAVQKILKNTEIKTSEGVVRINPVEYTLAGWTENFKDYLSSAMSYTNSKTLNEFIGKVDLIPISTASYNRFSK